METRSVFVDSKTESTATGVKIEIGDYIEVVSISGSFTYSKTVDPISYSGNANTPNANLNFTYSDATDYSLVAYFGDKANHFQALINLATKAETEGELFFAINDSIGHYADNDGGFDVKYRVIRKDEEIRSPRCDEITVEWVNKTGWDILVNWIDRDGAEIKDVVDGVDHVISPNETFNATTHIGHIFRVRGYPSNNDFGLIVVTPDMENYEIYNNTKPTT